MKYSIWRLWRIRSSRCGMRAFPLRSVVAGLMCLAAYAAAAAADESAGVLPRDSSGRPLNLDFESGTLDDWTAQGEAFTDQPIEGDTVLRRRADMRSEHQGAFWIGGYERHQDPPTGTLMSATFEVTHPWATFLIGGGRHAETRVELCTADDGQAFYEVAGSEQENLRRVVVDLRDYQRREIFIRLVDEHTGHWGHLNFDDFRFHATAPADPTPQLVRAVTLDEDLPAGLTPAEAARAMTLPDGFAVTVFAGEPDVHQPIAMALDARGRLWVAEAYTYPNRAPEGQGRDRILIFEDAAGDGKFSKRTVFTEGLNLVSGLEVGFGGVWIGAPPYLLFIPDRNGDDVPDGEPQVLLDGFHYEDTHETLNTFIWGPDGWLYGCHGVFTHSLVGKPGAPERERTPLNAGIWRYHPTRHEFEVFAHGTSNPWGVDFDDHGQAFCTACVIPHLYHVVQGGRYQRQAGSHFNPYTYSDIQTIADHVHYVGDIRDHAWWGHEPRAPQSTLEAGGGHAHCGAMIYLGDNWPEEYRNSIYFSNIHGNRINNDILQRRGSGYVGHHGSDLMLANDLWFRGINLRYGADGGVYLNDWYDQNACHRTNPEIWDRTSGRIYKIFHGEPTATEVDLEALDDLALAELQLHKNEWYVRTARRVLQQRAARGGLDAAARDRLVEIAATHADETRRLRAMWVLHVTGGLPKPLSERLLADPDPYVRGWTIQLALERADTVSDSLLERLAVMARDDWSPVVRLYIASALQRLPHERRWNILDGLVRHAEDAADHNLPLMIWYAAEPLAEMDAERALALGLSAGEAIPLVRDFMLRRIGSTDTSQSLSLLIGGLGKTEQPQMQLTFLKGIRAALAGQRRVTSPAEWAPIYEALVHSEDGEVRLQALALGAAFGNDLALSGLRKLVASRTEESSDRRAALEALLTAGDTELVGTLQSLVDDGTLRDVAIRGLAQFDDPETAAVLLAAYPDLSPTEKRTALATLSSRAEYGAALLRAIEREEIPAIDLTSDLARQLQYIKSEQIDELLARVWGSVRETADDKAELIAAYKEMVAAPSQSEPDLELGRTVFTKTCQQCHTLYGTGGNVGPDLTGSNRSDLDYLLTNIVDPSSVMAKEYQPTVVVTVNGRIITGLLRAEDDRSITLQSADETLVLPKDEIDERFLSEKSMMPDDQLKQFSDHEIRSLVAYLRTQAPLGVPQP